MVGLDAYEDTTFTNDEDFTAKWVAFYEENQTRIDEDGDEELVFAEDLIAKFYRLYMIYSGWHYIIR